MNTKNLTALTSITLVLLLCIGSVAVYAEGALPEPPPEPSTETPETQSTPAPAEETTTPSPTPVPSEPPASTPITNSEKGDDGYEHDSESGALPSHIPEESQSNALDPLQQQPEYRGVIALEAVEKITVELKDGRQMVFRLPVSAFGDYTILQLLSLILTPDFEESVGLTIYE